jgi:hypothetical protein
MRGAQLAENVDSLLVLTLFETEIDQVALMLAHL